MDLLLLILLIVVVMAVLGGVGGRARFGRRRPVGYVDDTAYDEPGVVEEVIEEDVVSRPRRRRIVDY